MRGLSAKVGIVAGGGRGIGAATAKRLASEGVSVVIGDIMGDWAREVADAIKAAADLGEQSLAFTEMEMGVLCAIAYHQPIDRA